MAGHPGRIDAMREQDPDRNVDLIRNVLLDEAWVAAFVVELNRDPLVYAEYYGRMVAVHRVALRLQITMPDKLDIPRR